MLLRVLTNAPRSCVCQKNFVPLQAEILTTQIFESITQQPYYIRKEFLMKKILFAFIGAFIALGWAGCEPKPGPDPEPEPDVPTVTAYFWMDSVQACCGIDSFAVKSPWVQQEISRFMADSVLDFTATLTIDYAVDKNGDYYFIEQYGWEINRLCDCSGNILKEINAYNEIYVELDIPVTDYGPIVQVNYSKFGYCQ